MCWLDITHHLEAHASRFDVPGGAGRDIASDMMEAIFLGDPGHFLQLDEGVRYYVWRRTLLKFQGKEVTDRLFPHFPVFTFDFNTSFDDTNFVVPFDVQRGTYSYIYSCWRRKAFPSSQDDRQASSNPNPSITLSDFLDQHKFWDAFDPRAKENSAEGAHFKRSIFRNIALHMDFAGQKLEKREFKDPAEAMKYVEVSSEIWDHLDFAQLPATFVPTQGYLKQLQRIDEIFPPAVTSDEGVEEREQIIHSTAQLEPENNKTGWETPLEQIALGIPTAREQQWMKSVTQEEADFMDELFDFDAYYADETGEEETVVHKTGDEKKITNEGGALQDTPQAPTNKLEMMILEDKM
jgi:hypothetical protein